MPPKGYRWIAIGACLLAVAAAQAPTEDSLLKNLKDPNPAVRAGAATTLGQAHDPAAVGPLLTLLGDGNPSVRAAAAQALGRIRDRKAVNPLLQVLADPDPTVRGLAAASLGVLGDPRAVPGLIDLLHDANPDVRALAVLSLGQLRDPRAVPPLIAALADEAGAVRGLAAQALARIGDQRAVLPVVGLLHDPVARNREIAAAALGAFRAAPAVAPLLAALSDPDPQLRAVAAQALGQIADASAVPALDAALRTDSEVPVRLAAAVALGQIGDSHSVESLIAALGDADSGVRTAAAAALDRSQDPRAAEPLRAAHLDPTSGGCPQPRGPLPPGKPRYEGLVLGVQLDPNTTDTLHFGNTDSRPHDVTVDVYDDTGCQLQSVTRTVAARATVDLRMDDPVAHDHPAMGWYRITSDDSKLTVGDTLDVLEGNEVHTVERGAPVERRGSGPGTWIVDVTTAPRNASMQFQFFLNLAAKPVKIGICQSDTPYAECREMTHEIAPLAEVVIPISRAHRYTLLQASALPAAAVAVSMISGDVKQFHASTKLILGGDAPPAAPPCAQPPCQVP